MATQLAVGLAVPALALAVVSCLAVAGLAIRLGRLEASLTTERLALPVGMPLPEDAAARLARSDETESHGIGGQLIVMLSPGCTACGEALGQLNRLRPDERGYDVVLVARDADSAESMGRGVKLSVRWIVDSDDAVRRSLAVTSFPTSLVVRDGMVVAARTGPLLDRLLTSAEQTKRVRAQMAEEEPAIAIRSRQ